MSPMPPTDARPGAGAFGIIARNERLRPAFVAGADYVEPIVVGTLVVPDGERWVRNPDYAGPERAPSFAILVPADLRLSDPRTEITDLESYAEQVFAIIGSVAVPGALVVLGSGGARTIPDGITPTAGRDRFADSVRVLRDAAERHGVRIILEPLNSRESNLICSLREAVDFLDEYGIDRVDVVADLQHMMVEGESLDEIVALGSRIGHAHICDTERTPPGRGDWPLGEFLTALRRGGYDGPVTIEANFTDFESELADALVWLRAHA